MTYAHGEISTKTTSFSLETLVRNIHRCTYNAHDAVEACKYLQKLIMYWCLLFELQFHKFLYYECYKTDAKYKIQFTGIDALDCRQSCIG